MITTDDIFTLRCTEYTDHRSIAVHYGSRSLRELLSPFVSPRADPWFIIIDANSKYISAEHIAAL